MFVGDYVRLCQLHNKVISELPENIKIQEAEEKAKREYEGLKKREDKWRRNYILLFCLGLVSLIGLFILVMLTGY